MSSTDSLREQIEKTLISWISDYGVALDAETKHSLLYRVVPFHMHLIEHYGLEQRIDALQWALNDDNMTDTDTRKNLEEFIRELERKKEELLG